MFEWDLAKAETNLNKHGISFEEASTVFNDPYFLIINTLPMKKDIKKSV